MSRKDIIADAITLDAIGVSGDVVITSHESDVDINSSQANIDLRAPNGKITLNNSADGKGIVVDENGSVQLPTNTMVEDVDVGDTLEKLNPFVSFSAPTHVVEGDIVGSGGSFDESIVIGEVNFTGAIHVTITVPEGIDDIGGAYTLDDGSEMYYDLQQPAMFTVLNGFSLTEAGLYKLINNHCAIIVTGSYNPESAPEGLQIHYKIEY